MKNQKEKGISSLFGIIVVIVIGAVAVGGILAYQYYYLNQKPVACTEEAKICPDGSAVGRTGPNCEFAACPTKEQSCISSGGKVSVSVCCESFNDFPKNYPYICCKSAFLESHSYLSDNCGCLNKDSHQVKVCDCGESKVFNGNVCVTAGEFGE